MLQINLLPIRQLKERTKAKQHLGMMLLLFLATLALLSLVGVWQLRTISSLRQYNAQQEQEKRELAPFLAELKALKEKQAEIQRKIAIIHQLRDESPLTVRVLDEVAKTIDPQRMWLTVLEQKDNSLTLSGVALDNQTIAQFMDNFALSAFVTDVTLSDSSMKAIAGRNLKSFALQCTVAYPGKENDDTKSEKNITSSGRQ